MYAKDVAWIAEDCSCTPHDQEHQVAAAMLGECSDVSCFALQINVGRLVFVTEVDFGIFAQLRLMRTLTKTTFARCSKCISCK